MYDVRYAGRLLSSLKDESGKSWIHLRRRPVIPAPLLDVTRYVVPGMDSDLTINEGTFRPIEITVEFSFSADKWEERIADFYWWLLQPSTETNADTAKTLSFGTNAFLAKWCYRVLQVIPGEPTRETKKIGKISATFVCDPFRYSTSKESQTFTATSSTGSASFELPEKDMIAKPEVSIKATGIGNIYLWTNKSTTANKFKLNITDYAYHYYILTDKYLLTKGTAMANGYGSGEYSYLWIKPGTNIFYAQTVSGVTASVTVRYNRRSL